MLRLLHNTDIIVLSSHDFGDEGVRTSKLMTKFSEVNRVYFFSQPIIGMTKKPTFYYNKESHRVTEVQPYLPSDIAPCDRAEALAKLIKDFIKDEQIQHLAIWTDYSQAMPLIRKLNPEVAVYDKVDPEIRMSNKLEQELLRRADVVLTAGLRDEELEFEMEVLKQEPTLPTIHEITELIVEQRAHTHHELPNRMVVRAYGQFN